MMVTFKGDWSLCYEDQIEKGTIVGCAASTDEAAHSVLTGVLARCDEITMDRRGVRIRGPVEISIRMDR